MDSIVIKHLSKSYGSKKILDNVSLNIPKASLIMLCGASGSGKSTLLSIIGGMEPADNGEVIIDGQNISALKEKTRADFYRHKVGFIFQGFYLQPQLTIAENIALTGTFAGMSKPARQQRTVELAEMLGIIDILENLPSQISGGQAERACAARAVFMHPEIVLADEPTNNLDPENARNTLTLLKNIQERTGTTMLIASHDPLVKEYATQVLHLKDCHITTEER